MSTFVAAAREAAAAAALVVSLAVERKKKTKRSRECRMSRTARAWADKLGCFIITISVGR